MCKEHQNHNKFSCVCGKTYNTKQQLSGHKTHCKEYQTYLQQIKEQTQYENEQHELYIIEMLKSGKPVHICENPKCKKIHDGLYGSGRFCCKSCQQAYINLISKDSPKRKQHLDDLHKKKQVPYGTWKCTQCNIIFNTKSELKNHKKQFHPVGTPLSSRKARRLTIEQKQKISVSCKNSRKKLISFDGSNFAPNYNKKSIIYLDNLSKQMGWNLQHAENGGEVLYFGFYLDGYDKEKNIVVEYDESRHYKDPYNNILIDKDIIRQNYIIDHLHCDFYRYNEVTGKLWKVN